MAIQIKELCIKVTVQDTKQAGGVSASGSDATQTDAIVQECIDKVMELLDQKYNER